ncbi:MAG TPA: beta-L-arabinofuranosidase domain-containing protein [Acidobacteriaceae bacterium]|nr:beta-L-arabinofuranosidase domain-containing protein [Acidobacteriaceae bacterium]
MKNFLDITRRRFLSTSASVAAYTMLQGNGFADALPGAAADSTTPTAKWREEGVIDLSNSPHARLKTVPIHAVVIQEGFWSKRRVTNVNSSIPSMHDELIEHGRMNNFLRLTGRSNAPQIGPYYSDSDIYKWVEAVGFALQSGDLPELRSTTEGMIRDVVAVQEPSGYLNTYFVGDRRPERMLPHTQQVGHETYCLGHMLQGAIAYYRATGDPTLLNAGIHFVDGFLLPNYGPAPDQKPILAGHPEIEMSLIELYRTTGNRRYLDLAGYILHGDNRIPLKPQEIVYLFCGIPFTSRTKLEGHAVRAMYACCGATDYYLETGDPAYLETLNTLWHDLSEHQMYVTGGVGARSQGESFGNAYELPNARAYGESCAAIGNMMWNWRMLSATGEARFTDVMERALYNGINSGMSLDGRLYCYRNPLAHDPTTGDKIRNPWYDTTCCPPNLERTFASLPGYFYSTSEDGVYVHLYDNSEMNWRLASGTAIKMTQQTNYPWEGEVKLAVAPATPETFTVFVRIPGWSRKSVVKVNGKPVDGVSAGSYLPIRRHWSGSDVIELAFDMEAQPIKANPAVTDDTDRIAMQRGPVVFCMEQMDQQAGRDAKDFYLYSASLSGQSAAKYEAALLGGVVTLEHPGTFTPAAAPQPLYQADAAATAESAPTTLKLIPYYAWANREDSAMQVWIPYQKT